MPAAAIPTWALITSTVAPAAASVAGAAMQSRATGRATRQQVEGANYAADRQLEASREAERFQRQQAQQAWASAEADRRANYDQWAARERRLGSIAEMLGYGRREIPEYVPSTNPNYMPSVGDAVGMGMPMPQGQNTDVSSPWTMPGANHGQVGHITRGGTVPLSIGSSSTPAAMSARDAVMARRYPQGSVGALMMQRRALPPGAGV